MKKQLFSLLLLISLSVIISAQTQEVQKIDEFGEVKCDEYLNKMDNTIILDFGRKFRYFRLLCNFATR